MQTQPILKVMIRKVLDFLKKKSLLFTTTVVVRRRQTFRAVYSSVQTKTYELCKLINDDQGMDRVLFSPAIIIVRLLNSN